MSVKIMRFARQSTIAAAALLLSVSTPSLAWDGTVTGKIAELHVAADGANYGFRVTLVGGPTICTGGPSWATISTSATNYQATVSMLALAYSLGKNVTIYTTKDANNYCIIGFISLS